ncbi:Na(+)/H(+) exchange regulatory cofactor NHE-RF3-like isoform X1 [Stegostoma tigrinum]|uniref:Na(+)/H(+) exchange regulatory cofactor NHE-RF3-like isoform X1 n=2 Tax=Stegostoma tigrinum TaxID=3053191 RepID=UPI00202B6F68|nr:Na(+)/H(+) exchange regulatory cofactor NHE-RF3-like isoform X1 [Stegostoma tigrinum]
MKEQSGIEDTKALSPTTPAWQRLTWCTAEYESRAQIPQGLSSGEYSHHWQTQDSDTGMVPKGHGTSVIRKFTFNPKEGIDNPALVICDDAELPILLKPRVCVLDKKDNEVFGFYLRGEKGKLGHIIRHVKPGSYAQYAGLFDADRVIAVNGEYVDSTEHSKVVEKIRLSGNKVTFLVVDGSAYEDAKMRNLNIAELIQSDIQALCDKPRMCYVERGPNGFGFELCSLKGAKDPFTLSVHSEGPAEKGGVCSEDTLIEINGINVEDCTYLQVKKQIKQSGDSVTLLVADQRTHAYYRAKGIRIIPAMACFKHLPFKPRKLYLVKGSCGYGFLLKTERKISGTYGQFLCELDAGSPAERCGMKEGDRLLAVNRESIEGLHHDAVVKKIRESGNQTTFIVISSEGDNYFTALGLSPLICMKDDYVEEQMESNQTTESCLPAEQASPRPCHPTAQQATGPKARLCHLVKGSSGYGFQIYCITDEPGIYIQEVIPGDVAYKAGIRDGDMLIEVNGMNIEKVCYEDVLEKIKEKQHKVILLVMNKKEYWYCKDNDIPISRESEDNEASKAESMEKETGSGTGTRKINK